MRAVAPLLGLATVMLGGCRPARPPATAAATPQAAIAPVHAIIPAPASVELSRDRFLALTPATRIIVQPGAEEAAGVGEYLASLLRPATGWAFPVSGLAAASVEGAVTLALARDDAAFGEEGYSLEITPEGVALRGATPAGLFHGVQTLRQMLPASIESGTAQAGPWRLPVGRIVDRPRFPWRGAMLDVARHFFGLDAVKRYIDLLAKYKINRLHLHLSDDQGWRIEITSWPRLAVHGGSTAVGGGAGGYYTQEQFRELVAYARARHIAIVPEIDMPGHTNAALASYGELNCNDAATDLYTGIEVGFSTLCVEKDVTYRFIDDVVRELAAMTPTPWIHIGGDEVEKLTDEQYARFVERVQGIVERHGKVPVGWEEITKARLKPTTIVQQWRTDAKAGLPPWRNEAATRAVAGGLKLVLSPAARVYLDMKYDTSTALGLDWAGYVEVRDAYDWDPASVLEGVGEANVLGVEAPLWSETLLNVDHIEQMAFPRIAGVAEIGWSPAAIRRWEEFRLRLAAHGPRWSALGVDFHRSPQVPWP